MTFPAETVVMVCAFTGNRDLEGDSGDVDSFDIRAERGKARPLTFGAGVPTTAWARTWPASSSRRA